MGRYSLSFFLFIFLFSLVACQDDDERALKNPGILSLVLASDTTFGGNFVATKATVLEELAGFTDPNEYAVEILQGEQVVLSFDRYADMPDEIELSAGSYTMRAYKGTNKPGAFANPYFEGKTNFVIEKDMRTPIRDTATLANTRVFVNYTEDFLDAYEEFRIRMNTEYMETDTLSFREDETRGAYFKSDATGTELILSLWLVKREDTIINYYKPTPLTIYPRENVGLLFKTDDGALTGIGLEVTVNRGFEGDTILNMTIPEYAWGDAEEPTLSTTYFPDSLDNITYFALQENTYDPGYVYLDYIVPAGVGRCMVQIKRIEENNSVTLEEYDLATPAGANAARSIGITLGSQNNSEVYSLATETKNGRIHFTDALAKLVVSENAVEYIYSVYVIDALPANPNSTDTVQMVLKPNPVGPSILTSVNNSVTNYTIAATEMLPNNVEVRFDTDAGIQSAKLTVERKNSNVKEYDIISSLPQGISYVNGVLTFDKNFVSHLNMEPGVTEEYSFTIKAIDNLGREFDNSPMNFSIKLTPVFEIIVPTEHIWGWKAQIGATVSGLTEANKSKLKLYISEDGNNYAELGNYTVNGTHASVWKEGLMSGKTYYVKAEYGENSVIGNFITENPYNIENGNLDTWYLTRKAGKYGGSSSLTQNTLYIPYFYVNNTNEDGVWTTNNYVTAGEDFTNTGSTFNQTTASDIPKGCFPTVTFESRADAAESIFAAVIRSIDADAGNNSKARGELIYNNTLTSRPSSISFEYIYIPVDIENFLITVKVYTGSEVIGKGVLSNNIQVDNYTEASIPIVYTEGNKKATSIEILFASSDTTTDFNIVSGGSVSIEVANSNTSGIVSSAGTSTTYNGVNYGSTLKIDNVTLNYTGE